MKRLLIASGLISLFAAARLWVLALGSANARNAGLAGYNHELTGARIEDFQAVPNPF